MSHARSLAGLRLLAAAACLLGGALLMSRQGLAADDLPPGPRAGAWQAVQRALDEGKPKTAIEALAGVEAAAVAERAWAEAARAIATRVLAETADRPGDDPERVIRLAAEIARAPAETRGVLEAIRANWTWGFYQQNQWRFQQRTAGGADPRDLARIAEWDLPTIVAEIRARFAAAVGTAGGPERAALQALPVAGWTALIEPGALPDTYRPTVWDVVARGALEFAASGERGLVAPEDAFEFDAESPAFAAPEAFLAWRPEADERVTDTGSPLLEAAALYRDLLAFHRDDADRTAFLAADLDRLLWAAGAAVGEGVADRREAALAAFVERAGDHETAALATFHLASLVREQGDLVEARTLAARAAERWPRSPGGALCANLVAEIESRELALATEQAWAAPWPVVRVTYRNLARVHLRLCRADWEARLRAGKPHAGWIDDADRAAILTLPAVRTHAADLPATADFHARRHDVPVGDALDAATLEPGAYWVIASHTADFGAADNVVAVTLVWVTRLALVTEQQRQTFPRADVPAAPGQPAGPGRPARGRRGEAAPLAGHVVDLASGEPVAGAAVRLFMRRQERNQQGFAEAATATTDAAGRFELTAEQGRELVVVAAAERDGRRHEVTTGSTNVWRNEMPATSRSIVLVTDRGIHRPGQTVFYKGIATEADRAAARYGVVADAEMTVVLRDANGREVATATHTTGAKGSFHGTFALPAGGLPGQWSIVAQGAGVQGAVGVRVEEYKRPKFLVKLAAPEKSVPLGAEASLTGRAETYTGLAVADATVRWRVERSVRFPPWCRWMFPWLPFDGGAQRIARGTARTGADGGFTITFPARPDRSLPQESLPVFTYRVVADVTDPGGETRSDERSVNIGYTDVEAALAADEWQAAVGGGKAEVPLTVTTTTLDGQPRVATGTLTVHRLVQPAVVARGDLLGDGGVPPWQPRRGRPGGPPVPPPPAAVDPANPETWAAGEEAFSGAVTTDAATGKTIATASLPAGIYRATFEIPAAAAVPAVRATRLVEVVDPEAERSGVRRAFMMRAARDTVAPGETYRALVGTGYDTGRALVEISQAGVVLERFWTAAGRTQWPVSFTAGEANRGGFTVRAWLVRDGRLHSESRTVDVPWTDKRLAIEWERFTRRTQPGARDVWRARVTGPAAQAGGPGVPAAVEMLAILYDQSLDALAPHAWPSAALAGILRRESSWMQVTFTNGAAALQHLHGGFDQPRRDVPEISYRRLRDPFGSPTGGWGFFDGGIARRGRMMMAPMAAAGPVADAMPAELAFAKTDAPGGAPPPAAMRKQQAEGADRDKAAAGHGDGGGAAGAAAPPPPRKNLVETAFFLPTLSSGADGVVTIEFTLPDTLTTWQFRGLAHDAAVRSGTLEDTCVAAKDLMVEPLVPRFLREGDLVRIPVKVSNASTGRLSGTVRFSLADARTDEDRGGLIEGEHVQSFDLAAGESRPVVFTVKVADGTDVLRYLATGSAGRAADGEEAFLPVLPRRVSVTETVPVTIRGPGTRQVALERLARSAGTDIRSQSLVVQAVSNPAWYAVLALPSIMEQADESTETLFTRLYANTLARHLATSDPRIGRVFAQWRLAGNKALESPLENNTELVQTLLAETPWVRDAVDEREARARIALLFDANRATAEARAALDRLEHLRNGDGGWPWFPGGRTCDSVTLGIVAGFGRLRAAGVPGEVIDVQPALRALGWLDGRLVEEKARALQRWGAKPDDLVLTPIGVYALYARSFFANDVPPEGPAAEAIRWALDMGRKSWMKLDHRRSQGHLAIALFRSGDRETALSIVDSLRQRAVDADVVPGAEKESWQGMWWRDPHPSWWSWASAPIATQAIMIEAFDEVAGDAAAVAALQVWLLSQKRTSAWSGSRATADAVGALLGRGDDLLGPQELMQVTVGGKAVVPEDVEAGTGFFETRLVRGEITPETAAITLTAPAQGLAFGGVHWQYLDDIANVPAAGREELAIEKKLFVKRFTKAGPELMPAGDGVPVEVGDELVVRLVVTSDRDYEFLELADHRPSLTEPVDVLSGWRFGDGVGWYVALRDASTRLYFERLPRGTHVFEYSLRAAHRGAASSGFAHIRSRYAPEFSAHSRSVPLEVR